MYVRKIVLIVLAIVSSTCGASAGGSTVAGTIAEPTPVPVGCAAPASSSAGRLFYIDPSRGSPGNDGSVERPWRTLQEVVEGGKIASQRIVLSGAAEGRLVPPYKGAVVMPGDTIILKTGNHGKILLSGAFNTKYVTIRGAPGEHPYIERLVLNGGGGWRFDNIIFQSQNSNGSFAMAGTPNKDYFLVTLTANPFYGPVHDIIISNNTFRSAVDVSNWTQADWRQRRASGLFLNGSMKKNQIAERGCIAIANNKFEKVGFGMQLYNSANIVVSGNAIDYFADDAIDYGSNDMLVKENVITNSVDDEDGFHRDAMQGQPYWGDDQQLHDLIFEKNVIVNQTDKNLRFRGYLQGIDEFNGHWNSIEVRHNVIVTNAYHGIAFYGARNLIVINNTVLGAALPGTSPTLGAPNSDEAIEDGKTWIAISAGSGGVVPSDAIIRNNIANAFVTRGIAGVIVDHNIIAHRPAGLRGGINTIGAVYADPKGLFSEFDPVGLRFDLRPRKGSVAIGAGSDRLVPKDDAAEKGRTIQVDIGAYTYDGSEAVNARSSGGQ